MLSHAFKEWAVICRGLSEGRQALILRKGGVAEPEGQFDLKHTRFWLFPTYEHQHRDRIKPEALPILEQAEAERPPAGVIRLSHFAETVGVYHVSDIVGVLKIRDLHLWSDEAANAKFLYRQKGLYVLAVRVYRVPQVLETPDAPAYAGCRSWVELEHPLSTEGATPVLDEQTFQHFMIELDGLLRPTAFA